MFQRNGASVSGLIRLAHKGPVTFAAKVSEPIPGSMDAWHIVGAARPQQEDAESAFSANRRATTEPDEPESADDKSYAALVLAVSFCWLARTRSGKILLCE